MVAARWFHEPTVIEAGHEIESGIVGVDTPLNDNDAVPFGGRKLTGSGRELGAS